MKAAAIAVALLGILAAADADPFVRAILIAIAAIVGAVVALTVVGDAMIGRDR